ncbi:MAG TPA: hypothetical protein VGT40_26445 [Methylomirabilota bacterium]|jgi:hypothetical protein|nr:hypothetical protein [Methylomirabilota bacterium]
MRRVLIRAALLGLAVVLVSGCGERTKEDIVQKSRNISTRAELEKALGRPTDIAKLGPLERWTYKASNGEVVFLIVGDKVTVQATGGSEEKK